MASTGRNPVIDAIKAARKAEAEGENKDESLNKVILKKPALFKKMPKPVAKDNQVLLSKRLKGLGSTAVIPPARDILITVYPSERWGTSVSLVPKYDPNHIWDVDFLLDFASGHENGDNVFVGGPTGTGKTMSSRNYSALVNKPWIRLNGREDMTADDIVGNMAVIQTEAGTETPFVKGALTEAMLLGADLCVDEPTQIPPSMAMTFQAPLEGMPLVITMGNDDFQDRIIEPVDSFRIICCDNSTGTGDESGVYSGCKVWNIATLDRFGTALWLDYLPKSSEMKMLQSALPDLTSELADKLITFASLVRKSHCKGDLQLTMSARGLFSAAKKCLLYQDTSRAIRVSFFNKFGNDAEKQAVSSMFFDAFGTKF